MELVSATHVQALKTIFSKSKWLDIGLIKMILNSELNEYSISLFGYISYVINQKSLFSSIWQRAFNLKYHFPLQSD